MKSELKFKTFHAEVRRTTDIMHVSFPDHWRYFIFISLGR